MFDPCASPGATHYACACYLKRGAALAKALRNSLVEMRLYVEGREVIETGYVRMTERRIAAALAAWEGRKEEEE